MSFQVLYNAARTKRWHTCDTLKEQNLADHQWGVALIVMELAPGNYNLLRAALVHDLGESVTGDIPYTGKRLYPELGYYSEAAERDFADGYGTMVRLSDDERRIATWADMLEAYLFAKREVLLGNTTMSSVVDNAREALSTYKPPNPRAAELLKEVL